MKYEPGKYVPTSEVALRWGVSIKTIQRLVQAGVLRGAKFGTRNLSILAEDVEKYEKMAEFKAKPY